MKPFALTSTSSSQIELCYLMRDAVHWEGDLVHFYYDTDGGWRGSGIFDSRDLLGGAFVSSLAAVAHLAAKPAPPIEFGEDNVSDSEPEFGFGPPIPTFPRLDLFGLGTDYAMWTQTVWDNVPSSLPQWLSLGGSFLSTPAAIYWQGRIDVFGLGTDRAVYQKTFEGDWSEDWVRLGGIMSSEVSAVSWGPNQLDIFARGSDYTLRHRAFNGTTWLTDWENFGGSLATQPVAVSWGANRLDIFAVADDGSMIHKWWDGTLWNDFEALPIATTGMIYTGIPAVTTWGPDRLDVFNTGSDGNLYQLVFDQGAWADPVSLGPSVSASVSAIALAPEQLLVVKYDGGSAPMNNFYTQGAWQGWLSVNPAYEGGLGLLPNRYIFTVEELAVITTRSLNGDTDTVQSTLNAGNWLAQSATYTLNNDIGGFEESSGASIQNCSFGPVTVELSEAVIFNYQVMNSQDPNIGAALESAGKSLAKAAAGYIAKAIGAGFSAITSVEIGSISSVPVIGTILGLVGQWLLNQLLGIIFAQCDGLVAVEQAVFLGKDLQALTASGPYTVTTTHPGIDSATGCGSNSNYTVTWTITPVR